MIRNWIKSVFSECVRDFFYEDSCIIANRPPMENDFCRMGSLWKHGKDKYVATYTKVKWVKVVEDEPEIPKD